MIQLTAKYYRKHFFGGSIYCEDDLTLSKNDTRLKEHIDRALKKVVSENFTLEIARLQDLQVLIIEKDFYNREGNKDIVKIRHFTGANAYTDFEMSMRKSKKLIKEFIEEDIKD